MTNPTPHPRPMRHDAGMSESTACIAGGLALTIIGAFLFGMVVGVGSDDGALVMMLITGTMIAVGQSLFIVGIIAKGVALGNRESLD